MPEYNRSMRLCKSDDYSTVFKNGVKFNSASFVIICHKNEIGPTRLGIIVSRKVGRAVLRNYFKRIFRDIFRIEYDCIKSGLDIVLIVKKRATFKNYFQLKSEFVDICNRL